MTDDFVLRRPTLALGTSRTACELPSGPSSRRSARPSGCAPPSRSAATPACGTSSRSSGPLRWASPSLRRRRCRSRRARDRRRGGWSPRRAGAADRDDRRRARCSPRSTETPRGPHSRASSRVTVATIAVARARSCAAARACGRHRADRRRSVRRRPVLLVDRRSSARGGEPARAHRWRGSISPRVYELARRRAGSGTVRSGEGRVADPHCGRAVGLGDAAARPRGASTRRSAARSVSPIGSFQAIAHPFVDVAIGVEGSAPARAPCRVVRRPRTGSTRRASIDRVRAGSAKLRNSRGTRGDPRPGRLRVHAGVRRAAVLPPGQGMAARARRPACRAAKDRRAPSRRHTRDDAVVDFSPLDLDDGATPAFWTRGPGRSSTSTSPRRSTSRAAHAVMASTRISTARSGQRGWVAPTWPPTEGGAGLDATRAAIVAREMTRSGAVPASRPARRSCLRAPSAPRQRAAQARRARRASPTARSRLPRLHRARRRIRPRRGAHASRARRRRVGPQRSEDVHDRRPRSASTRSA